MKQISKISAVGRIALFLGIVLAIGLYCTVSLLTGAEARAEAKKEQCKEYGATYKPGLLTRGEYWAYKAKEVKALGNLEPIFEAASSGAEADVKAAEEAMERVRSCFPPN